MVCIYVSIYLCMYHLPHVCRTLVPEFHIHPKILRVFWCWHAHVRDLKLHSTEQQERLELFVSAMKMQAL